jgi:hypothetical protein
MIFTFIFFSDAIVGSYSCTEIQSISHGAFSESEKNWLFHEQFLRSFLGGGSQKHAMGRLTASARNVRQDDIYKSCMFEFFVCGGMRVKQRNLLLGIHVYVFNLYM